MYAQVKVILQAGVKKSVIGTYQHQGRKVMLMDDISPSETAKSVRAAQFKKAEQLLGIGQSEPA